MTTAQAPETREPHVATVGTLRVSSPRWLDSYWMGGVMTATLVFVVLSPLLLTERSLGGDLWLHIRMLDQQRMAWAVLGHPTITASFSPVGALNVAPAMYGGTLYAFGGLLAFLGLGTLGAFSLLVFLCGWAGAFGVWWVSRLLGPGGWWSVAPPAVLVTSSFFLGDLIGRGGVSEFAAMQGVPLIAASACDVVVHREIRGRAALALLVGSTLAFGSHSITALWLPILGLLGLIGLRMSGFRLLKTVGVRRSSLVALLVLFGSLIPMWALVPAAVLSGRLSIAPDFASAISGDFRNLFVWLNPLRTIPPEHVDFWRSMLTDGGYGFHGSTSLYAQLAVLPLGWAAVVLGRTWNTRDPATRALQWGLAFPSVLVAMLILVPALWTFLPDIIRTTQYSFRLNGYLDVLVAGMVCVAIRSLGNRHKTLPGATGPRRRSVASLALCLIIAFCFAQSCIQGWRTVSFTASVGYDAPRSDALKAPFIAPDWYAFREPRALDGPRVVPKASTPTLPMDFSIVNLTEWTWFRKTSRCSLAISPVVAPWDLISVTGGQAVGRTDDGFIVLESCEQSARVSSSWPWWRSLGLVLSCIGLVFGATLVALAPRMSRRHG